MSLTEWLIRIAIALAIIVAAFALQWAVDRWRNPPKPSPPCFDCRHGHHDHAQSGTCRRPDCGCTA